MTATVTTDGITVNLTPEQHRYVMTSLQRMSRQDRRGAAKIQKKFQAEVKDKSLLKRLELANECIAAFTVETSDGPEPSSVPS